MFDPKAFLETLATKWSVKFPDDADRIKRGLEVALSNKVSPRTCESWRVVGSEKGSEYLSRSSVASPRALAPTSHGARAFAVSTSGLAL